MRAFAGLLMALVGCQGGRVVLAFDAPTGDLDPLVGVDELILTATVDGARVWSSAIASGGERGAVDFGEVPVGSGVRLDLRGVTGAGRVVAFGRAPAPVDVAVDEVVTVPMHVRRPLAYVAGGAQGLLVIDATREPGEGYAFPVELGDQVDAVAATSDGGDLVVATDAAVHLMSTWTHQLEGPQVALPGPAAQLAISADDRWAAVTHLGPTTGVSIIDLASLRAGVAIAPWFVAVPDPGAVGIAGDTVWVLDDPLDMLFCGGASGVYAISLIDRVVAPRIALAKRATDLTVDPATGAAIVSMPCGNEIVAIDAPGAAPRTVVTRDGLSAVTVVDGRVWATGQVPGVEAHLMVVSVPVAGGALEELHLPATQERAVATALDRPGQAGQVQLAADLHTAFALSVLPDGEHVAIVEIGAYLGQRAGDAGGGRPIVPAITMTTYEYQLIQLDTGLGAQRLRLACEITWEPGALLDRWECGRTAGQDEAPIRLTPKDLSALYGSR